MIIKDARAELPSIVEKVVSVLGKPILSDCEQARVLVLLQTGPRETAVAARIDIIFRLSIYVALGSNQKRLKARRRPIAIQYG